LNPEIAHVAGGGRPSARLRRLLRDTGRGINEFAMIGAGDRVIVGVSGGKDSLTLALALSLRRRHLPISYEVEAVHVNWREHALAPEQLQRLQAFFDAIEVPFRSIPMSMFPRLVCNDEAGAGALWRSAADYPPAVPRWRTRDQRYQRLSSAAGCVDRLPVETDQRAHCAQADCARAAALRQTRAGEYLSRQLEYQF